MEEEERAHHEKLREISADETELVFKKGQLSIDYAKRVEQFRALHSDLIAASIARIEAQSDHEFLKAKQEETRNMLQRLDAEAKEAEKAKKEAADEGRKLRDKVIKLQDEKPELHERREALSDEEKNKTVEELRTEIEGKTERLHLLQGGNAGVLREFEKRAREIWFLLDQYSAAEPKPRLAPPCPARSAPARASASAPKWPRTTIASPNCPPP